ncbi:hypothetical protein RHMOL_Rhmol08G0115200 [Rhododendron molle]|nr:hypothetical protein RHMOL_Rhmol08G0115200 [Rhododendron molle]
MMDHKTWLWKKRSTEKTLVAADKSNASQRINEEEIQIQILQTDKVELERDLKILNEKLSFAHSDCNAKDELVEKHEKMAQEALAGWEKAESEAMSMKQELDDVKRQRVSGEERITQLDMALKECMQQLRFVRDEQEQRIHDAVVKTSGEFEKARIVLEEKLADTDRKLSKLGVENTQLSKALLAKEKLIQDVNEQRTRVEVDFKALMIRLESTEKENTSLKYEVRVLEKELEIRSEEREFNRRTADVAHKQHLESAKKIAKLESECQRLRVLVRKRLPGPAALAKMKNEVEILGRDRVETRRRNSNPSSSGSVDLAMDNFPDTPSKRLNYLVEKLNALEEENKSLKETQNNKTSQIDMESERSMHLPYELSVASMSDMGSDDKVSSGESLASALFSDLEHFKNGKRMGTLLQKTVGASDIDLMDDFAEMEKLAVVSLDKPFGSPHLASIEGSEIVDTLENRSVSVHSDVSGYGCWKHPDKSALMDSALEIIGDGTSFEKKKHHKVQSNLNKSMRKIIELVEGISLPSLDYGAFEKDGGYFTNKDSETTSGYMVRVFQWKTSELRAVLQQFIRSCNDFLIGEADFEKFAEELTLCLDWVINHCFSLQDVSSMREKVKKHFNWDESHSESEVEVGTPSQCSEADKLRALKEKLSHLPRNDCKVEDTQCNVRLEDKKLEDKLPNMEYANQDLEGRLQSEFGKSESLMIQLQESDKTRKGLQRDLETLKGSNGMIENQIDHHKSVNADLDTQLKDARAELNKAHQRFASPETKVENKSDCREELEATCVDLQFQPERVKNTETPKGDTTQEEKQLRSEWEITAASEKLAECQETILNLGKQLKALAAPKDSALLDNLVSNPSDNFSTTPPKKSINQRSSLLDKMLAEDNARNTMEVFSISGLKTPPAFLHGNSGSSLHPHGKEDSPERFLYRIGSKCNGNEAEHGSLAITPVKKNGGGGLFKKLLWRRNKGKNKKLNLPFAC